MAEKETLRIQNLVKGKNMFMVIDETEVADVKYINTLVGNVESPENTFLLHCKQLAASVNSQTIIHAVDDAIKMLQSDRSNFVLLLSDAARCMTAAGRLLKQIYPRLLHVTCAAHLLHNCTKKVRAHFSDVDNLITRVKNKDRKELFATICQKSRESLGNFKVMVCLLPE